MRMSRVPQSTCPVCGTLLNAASFFTGESSPRPGDLSVCIECTAILVFQADLTVQGISEEELESLPPELHVELIRMRQILKEFHQDRKRRKR